MAEKEGVSWSRTKKPKHKNHPQPDMANRIQVINAIWEYSRMGYTQETIGQMLGIAQQTVSKLFREGYTLQATKDGLLGAEEERIKVLKRLEYNYELCMMFLHDGGDETKLLPTADRILGSIRKLQGLDKPTKIAFSAAQEALEDPEFADWVAKMKANSQKREAELNEEP